jgi:DNA repair exonuclease SbcCD ATPase subunit
MVAEAKELLKTLEPELARVSALVTKADAESKKFAQAQAAQLEWEKYYGLIDHSMASLELNKDTIEKEIKEISSTIANINRAIAEVSRLNAEATAHNTKIDVITSQMDTISKDLVIENCTLDNLNAHLSTLGILQKTFSTTGLVAYKIECLVKDLEQLTNDYLLDMSDGRFQISFKVNSSDKLNVIITDNSTDIDILALSNGERARVNISTLLAIRKLMQSLSNSRINLLILDETIETLDVDGKEKLIEVLLKEQYLNTLIVSHGFSHPLLEKINIIKENNISRVD